MDELPLFSQPAKRAKPEPKARTPAKPKPSPPREEKGNFRLDFSRVLGQEKVKKLLSQAILRGRVSKAYLFYGPEGSGKDAMAIELAKALNCQSPTVRPCQTCAACRQIASLNYPDLHFIFAAPKSIKEEDYVKHLARLMENPYQDSAYSSTATISIERIRELKRAAALKRHQRGYQVTIISQADRMTPEAANSLLKLLEEPPPRSVLILTTSRLERLFPTIISRCQVVQFAPLQPEEIREALPQFGASESQAEVVSRLAMGNFRKAREILHEDFETLRKEALELLRVSRSADELTQLSFVEELGGRKDRGKTKELLLLALLWLRDAQLFASAQDRESVREFLYNADKIEEIRDLVQLFQGINLEKTIAETENSIDLIEKNVYINLVLIHFVNALAQRVA